MAQVKYNIQYVKPNNLKREYYRLNSEIRKKIFERDNYKCVCCGNTKHLSIDHILPRSMGGNDNENNLQTLCKICNSRKGKNIKDYRK